MVETLLGRVKNRAGDFMYHSSSSLRFCPLLGPALHPLYQEPSPPSSPSSCANHCILDVSFAKRQ